MWLTRRVEAGFKAVMMTVDATMLGRRLNEYRNSFGIPEGMGYPNILPGADMTDLVDKGADLAYGSCSLSRRCAESLLTAFSEDGLNWEQAIGWIRSVTKLDIWLKGGIIALNPGIIRSPLY